MILADIVHELDSVVLTRDLPQTHLRAGDIGAVVHRYGTDGYEVEFVAGSGETVGVLTLDANDIRPLAPGEILHARPLQ